MLLRIVDAAGTRSLSRAARGTRRFLQTKTETIMTMRIAIIAACAGTLALAQADVAQASYAAASGSKTLVRSADVGLKPAIVVAQNAAINTSRSNIKHPSKAAEANSAMGEVSTTRGRKLKPAKAGKAATFDRRGNLPRSDGKKLRRNYMGMGGDIGSIKD